MELRDYLRVFRKNVWLIITVIALAVAAAATIALTTTPRYEAETAVFVSTRGSGSLAELQQGTSFTQSRVETYAQIATTPIVLGQVIDEMDLDVSTQDLARQISATAPTGTTLIRITAQDPDPVRAAEIADATAVALTVAVQRLETLEGDEQSPVKLTQVQPAVVPSSPASPNVSLLLGAGLAIGVVLAIFAAVIREALDNRVRSVKDVQAITTAPIIGSMVFDPNARRRPLVFLTHPHDSRSEALRALRTNLRYLDFEGSHSFVLTSSIPAEGKTTVAVNLALALAEAGTRVLLVDADLRRPKVHEYLRIEGGVGLTDLLIGRAEPDDVITPFGDRDLHVLPAGHIPPNPAELLGSERMRDLLKRFEADFDMVIIDAPPLLPVTDAAVLATLTSGAILLVGAGRARRPQLTASVNALEAVGAHVAGIVMSMLPSHGPDADTYSYSYRPTGDAPETRRGRRGSSTRSDDPDAPGTAESD